MRHIFVFLHRYVGLAMAGFLLLNGITGALLVWYHELDSTVNPSLYEAPAPSALARPIDPFTLRERVQAHVPGALVTSVPLQIEPGLALSFRAKGAADPVTKQPAEIANDEFFVNPYTGEVQGARRWGAISQGGINLMPFVYRLHRSLALNTIGTYVFGIVALLWTLDCFVGAYLTFPLGAGSRRVLARTPQPLTRREKGERGWWARWRPSWTVRWYGGSYKRTFDLHRAFGLWVWAILFVLAWSGVAFNLNNQVYRPVMGTLFGFQDSKAKLPKRAADQLVPDIAWRDAHRLARQHMARFAAAHGFSVLEEAYLNYDPSQAVYRYSVKSSRDIGQRSSGTQIYFDANTGTVLSRRLPTGEAAGDTFTTWITTLHRANIWGLPFRVFVCAMGLVVAMLSITGLIIWLRKRRARRAQYAGANTGAAWARSDPERQADDAGCGCGSTRKAVPGRSQSRPQAVSRGST